MLLGGIFERLKNAWPGSELHRLRLALSPFLTLTLFAVEFPMIRLSQKFEFSASHRLHNPALSDAENQISSSANATIRTGMATTTSCKSPSPACPTAAGT